MRGQSAVYDDCLSGDIPGVVRGEKGNGGCHTTNAIIVTGIALVNTIFVYTRIGKLKYAFT